MKPLLNTIIAVILFAIAMGFLEAAVVIYLREIYYKEGFGFPLKPMSHAILLVEIIREAATVIMLLAVGHLAGKNKLQRFAYFTFSFAVWDIFYYVFLYVFLGWPQSLLTWDILFLIPVPWVGPVWAPCLLSLLMVMGALEVILQTHKLTNLVIKQRDWLLLIAGALICIFSFMFDYLSSCFTNCSSTSYCFQPPLNYMPQTFNYPVFLTGFICMCIPVFINIQSIKTLIK